MRGLPDVGLPPFLTGNTSWLPAVICQGCLFPALTAGDCHGGKMPSSPISLSSTLFALVTGPSLPLPTEHQQSCTLPKTQSSCTTETSLGAPVPYWLGGGLCSCQRGLLFALPSHNPWSQIFVLRLTGGKSVTNCGVFC